MNKILLAIGLFVVLFLVSCSSISSSKSVDYELTATKQTKEYISGLPTVTYEFNDQTPGPILYATVGEEFSVRAKNFLEEPITIHWHGMQLPNEMDGVPSVTQPPIKPGDSFDYRFTPQNPGVYWYHSHVDAHKQVEMGLQGAMIVKEQDEKIYSDSETVLVLDDVAINDRGEYASFDLNYMHGRFGSTLLVNGMQQPTIEVSGNTHRFRIVNTANARSFNMNFGGNSITSIGEDIGYVKPYEASYLTIHPGERYDVLVSTNTSFSLSHLTSRGSQPLSFIDVQEPLQNVAIQEYIPLPDTKLPDEVWTMEPTMIFDLEGVRDPTYGLVWNINGANSLTNPQTFPVKEGELIKLRLINTQGQGHPMHLHGQKFKIISRNGVIQTTGGWKDTVMMGNREVVDIAFIAEEEGEWVFHCHILEHAKAGMLTSLTVE
jgi:FtsP/CotA-like multicopper oxidase with cupredoxin domain